MNEVIKYRKKPVVIEAIEYSGARDIDVIDFTNNTARYDRFENCLIIPTLEGDHRASPGDYIIKGVKGEFYPCKPDIFEATYERVESEGK